MADVFLSARHITKRYGGVVALQDVDLTIHAGEIHCLVGENGSGKSTLVKIITGVVQPEPGAELEIAGRRVRGLNPYDALRMGIQVVHQDLSLFPNLTVAENIAIPQYLEQHRGPIRWSTVIDIARKAVEKVGVNLAFDAPVGALPIADQQLVAICRALASEARMLVMDEPTASLTRQEVDRLFGILQDLQAHGIAVLFVGHKLDEIMEIAQRVTVLRDGRKVGTYDRQEIDRARLAYLMTGKQIAHRRRQAAGQSREVVLEVAGLSRKGNFAGVSFRLHRGEVLGIIGPRGSGKTELALALFGMNPPDRGTIIIEGQPVVIRSNADAIRLGIAYVPEDRLAQGIVASQPVSYNLIITALDRLRGPLGLISPRKRAAFCDAAVQDFDIRLASLDQPARALSGGNQQKVVIAKWLSTKPKILILDGPTIGIDVGAKETIYQVIRNLASEGVSILLISEEVSEVVYNCDRILLMKSGRIAAELAGELLTEEEVSRRMLGAAQLQRHGADEERPDRRGAHGRGADRGGPVPPHGGRGPAISRSGLRQALRRTEFYLLAVLVALSSILAVFQREFLSKENIFDILRNNAFLGVVALGQLVVLISGGIDVSFTAVATVAQYVMGVILSTRAINSALVAFLIPLPIGVALGALNALLVHYTRVHSVIITIATLNAHYGLLIFFTGGAWITDLPPAFQQFAQRKVVEFVNEAGATYGLSIFTVLWLAVAAATWFVLTYTPMGRKIYALGGNAEAARRAGFNISRIHLFVYAYMGLLAGLASFVQAGLAQIIQPNAMVGRELDVLAAAVLGGASVFGGRGTVAGTVLGVLLIAVIRNGLILMRVSSYWHEVVIGAVLLVAAAITACQERRRAYRVVRIDVG
ncbi:MAG: ATP-binding cassette domain-containing protein [Armatimonadota bacterium]|nr:ATP-binding cassette domain-containing protein [Armatimonadota bacterium]